MVALLPTHFHEAICCPALVGTAIAEPVDEIGVIVMPLVSISLSLKPVAIAVITPSALVVTLETYFDDWLVDSQPQPLMPGTALAFIDW